MNFANPLLAHEKFWKHLGKSLQTCLMVLGIFLISSATSSFAQAQDEEDPEESDYPPGLLATYRAGETEIQRIDPQISFAWDNERPDIRLPAGPFSAEWAGYFLMKAPGEYRFHAYLEGEVEVRLDDRVVLQGKSDKPEWVSGDLHEFSFGDFPIQVTYQKTGASGTLKLFWSSPQFALEPISTFILFREAGNPELASLDRGRLAFQAWRCAHCHDTDQAWPKLSAPSLQFTSGTLDPSWIVNKLTQPSGKHDHMPEFSLTEKQAADVTSYLLSVSSPTPKIPKQRASARPQEDTRAGQTLVNSTGCLVCHVVGELGQPGPFGGGELTQIGDKRSQDWLAHWLRNSADLNPHHRMPQLVLSTREIQQVSHYLAGLKSTPEENSAVSSTENINPRDKDAVARGKDLVSQLRCASCHDIPGISSSPAMIPFSQDKGSTPVDCLHVSPEDRKPHQPHFPQAPSEDIAAWLNELVRHESARKSDKNEHSYQRGHDLLIENNCLACHSRDRNPGNVQLAGTVARIDQALNGQSQSLIPPHLSAVGDRLQDEALREALSGMQPRRLGWLSVRMPRFKHTAEEMKHLEHYLIGHDRLPESIPDERLKLASIDMDSSEELLMGRELIGGRAFNCIACHKVGDYEPRNTAIGTRGSDLLGVAGRLRPEYFLRWVQSPLRIVPGMEMPSFNQPRAGFVAHELDQQLSAIWRAVNDPTFKAPSNPTVVEQYMVIAPNQSTRVVRDVVELKDGQKERIFVTRPLAVGLNNGHSLLFDLDTASLRGWAYGDFAYQKTEGKSWFWYLAGAPIATGWTTQPDITLASTKEPSSAPILPEIDGVRHLFLKDYQLTENGIQFDAVMKFSVNGKVVELLVQETWTTINASEQQNRTGWRREIKIQNVPEGYQPVLNQQAQQVLLGNPELAVADKKISLTSGQKYEVPFQASSAGQFTTSIDYTVGLTTRATDPFPPKPEIQLSEVPYTGTPGFHANRLPISSAVMPTAMSWLDDGTLVFTSLKGHVYAVKDSNNDGIPDQLQLIEEGLGSPFGILAQGDRLLVAHKPEILELDISKLGSNGPTVRSKRIKADGWGHSDDYHDWTSGFAIDQAGQIYVGTGSDYAYKNRPVGLRMHRGEVVKLTSNGGVESVGTELRYPVGIASDHQGRVFVSDQQGVQNSFNEINHIVPGGAYGVPALNHPAGKTEKRASIQLPHPWTRSVNGLFFIPFQDNLGALSAFQGHGIGCEYNNRFLVRFSLQDVNGEVQGACYELTRSIEGLPADTPLLMGPIGGGVGKDGNIYVGSIHDSGWLGGQNIGEIVQLKAEAKLPNGIRELRAIPGGFEVEFIHELDQEYLSNPQNYDISGYTRVWQGGYATPDSNRYRLPVKKIEILQGGRLVKLMVDDLRPSYVYDLHLKNRNELFPASGYYTMNQVPKSN